MLNLNNSTINMETEVIEFSIGLGGEEQYGEDDCLDIEHSVDEEDMESSLAESNAFYIPDGDFDLEPYEGMEFESEEAAKAFYNSYARRVGFSTRVSSSRRSRRHGAIIQRLFVCAKEGFRNLNEKRSKDREIKRPRTITRVGCKASLAVKIQDSGKWIVSVFVKEHNHELVPPDQVHCLRSHRQISGPAKTLIDTLQAAGMGPRRIMSALIKEYGGACNVGFTEVDCRNYMRSNRRRSLEGDILLLDYLRQLHSKNPSFFYSFQGDDEDDQCISNVFWADPKARTNYTYFGDTVTFDTTYRSNKYRLPFAPFTGVNHHGHPVLFGCAFIVNESEPSFIWLLKTWLIAMSGSAPVSITTHHDPMISRAIAQVFPNTRHRFCKWHIFKKCQEKLSHVFLHHPTFEAEFHKCVNTSDSIEEFESSWFSLLDRFALRDHGWLNVIYSDRRQWVPVYLRDTFFAEMSSDGMNSYFDGYINASTTLGQFFKQYEKAIESRNEKEVRADYDTMNTPPVLRTPSPMEKQASKLYTQKLFLRFQEEFVGMLTFMASKIADDDDVITYQVIQYGDDPKPKYVRFNVVEMKASCSCQMFEFSGLLCRHVLAVFRVTNILILPSRYILRRWTKNAKSSVILEEYDMLLSGCFLESQTVRYKTLRHEALKFVEEGATSIDAYNVAMAGLKEAAQKVSFAAKNRTGFLVRNGFVGSNLPEDDDMEKKMKDLECKVESANRKAGVYRSNLLAVLKGIEEHKQHLSIKVENIKVGMMQDRL